MLPTVALIICASLPAASEAARLDAGSRATSAGLAWGSAPVQVTAGAEDEESLPYPREGDEDRQRAIKKGLAWLATRQEAQTGSMAVGDAGPGERAPVAVTSLAALAWMAGGSTTTRGVHQENVTRAIEYLLACTQGDADKYPGFISDQGDPISRTHGHGLATLALAEAYTVSPVSPLGKRIGTALARSVARIESSQGAEGGWHYYPYRSIEHEGSVTVALVQALRAADDVGIRVNPGGIALAVDYMRKLQILGQDGAGRATPPRDLGGFRYGLGDPKTSVALTAAGLATLQAAGVYSGKEIEEGYDYIYRELTFRDEDPRSHSAPFPYYERFYLSQALWHQRDTVRYREWVEPRMRSIVALQEPSGAWNDVRSDRGIEIRNRYGSAYATACNVLFLALPDDSLPVFHR